MLTETISSIRHYHPMNLLFHPKSLNMYLEYLRFQEVSKITLQRYFQELWDLDN